MFKTVQLPRLFGIDLFIHWTVWPLLLYLVVAATLTGNLAAVTTMVSLLLIFFVAIVTHELGHALVAQSMGVRAKDIVILPIGGIARLENVQLTPRKELWIVSAGPLVNIILGLATWGIGLLIGESVHLFQSLSESSVVMQFAQVNLLLGISNLLPALPLDGGRMLRAMFAMRYSHLTATQIVARMTRWVGIAMIVVGFALSLWLILFGVFLFAASLQEVWAARLRSIRETQNSGTDWQRTSAFDNDESDEASSSTNTIDAVDVKRI
jgi:Zn-dependent protease